jgi:hypothetical protein
MAREKIPAQEWLEAYEMGRAWDREIVLREAAKELAR